MEALYGQAQERLVILRSSPKHQGANAEQLQKVCSEPGSGAYTDSCIKAYAAERQADVNTVAAVLDIVTRKSASSSKTDKRNETLCDKVADYESAIKLALASGREVGLSRDAKGQGLARMVAQVERTRIQLRAFKVSEIKESSPSQ